MNITRFVYASVTFILAGLLLAACRPVEPLPAPEIKTPVTGPAAPAPGADREQKWESVLSEAKKEGVVGLYTSWPPRIRIALTQAFKQKYGIDLEFSPFSRGEEAAAKIQTEQRAGIYAADAFGAGDQTLLLVMKPLGLLGPIKPLLLLPEVLEPKAWLGGGITYGDKDGTVIKMLGIVTPTVAYNTDLVKDGEITTVKDLLKPQYRGKITMNDPTVAGSGTAVITHLGFNLWGEAEAKDFLRRLIKEQEAVIQRDAQLNIESVARGKYAIALGPSGDRLIHFISVGAPVKSARVVEQNRVTSSSGILGVPTRFAHPNAATVFVNWLLTREGQSVFAPSFGGPSLRLDATTEGVEPFYMTVPGEKYYIENEDFTAAMEKWREIAKQIVAEAR